MQRLPWPARCLVVGTWLMAGLGACGRASKQPRAPADSTSTPAPAEAAPEAGREEEDATAPGAAPPPPPAEPTLDESDLERAERELTRAAYELSILDQPVPTPDSAEGSSRSSGSKPADRCQMACRAFASLARARDAICRIDGQQGERCARANSIVEHHTSKVQACSCPP